MYIRAIQGHTGGQVIEPEMTGHVCIPLNWKQFVFHRSCSFHLKSMLGAGPIARERQGREKRRTVFLTPLNPSGAESEEEFHDDLTKPRRVHYKNRVETLSRHRLVDPLWKAQVKGIAFWQTKSHAIIAYSTFPQDCIERVISQRGGMTIYQRSSKYLT